MWAELYTQDSQHDILRKCGVANVIFLPLIYIYQNCKRGVMEKQFETQISNTCYYSIIIRIIKVRTNNEDML